MRVTFKNTDLKCLRSCLLVSYRSKCLCPHPLVSYRFHVAQADLPKVAIQLKMILTLVLGLQACAIVPSSFGDAD